MAFFCITLSIIVLRWWWKNQTEDDAPEAEVQQKTISTLGDKKAQEQIKEARKRRLETQKQADAELIATVLPVINDGE